MTVSLPRAPSKCLAAGAIVAGLMMVALGVVPAFGQTSPEGAAASGCRSEVHAGASYVICRFDPSRVSIETIWRDADDAPFGSLSSARTAIERGQGRRVLMMTNGGMYHEGLGPVGYYVEERIRLKPANTRAGPGNFHMRPNGIFFVEAGRPGVLETGAFLRRNRRPDFATQSGPMLVIEGRLHPIFKPDSPSLKIRNGVGVTLDGSRVTFALSETPVSFYAFAELFRDVLGAHNALFLDGGSVPQLLSPTLSRGNFSPVGPMIAVTTRARAAADTRN